MHVYLCRQSPECLLTAMKCHIPLGVCEFLIFIPPPEFLLSPNLVIPASTDSALCSCDYAIAIGDSFVRSAAICTFSFGKFLIDCFFRFCCWRVFPFIIIAVGVFVYMSSFKKILNLSPPKCVSVQVPLLRICLGLLSDLSMGNTDAPTTAAQPITLFP